MENPLFASKIQFDCLLCWGKNAGMLATLSVAGYKQFLKKGQDISSIAQFKCTIIHKKQCENDEVSENVKMIGKQMYLHRKNKICGEDCRNDVK